MNQRMQLLQTTSYDNVKDYYDKVANDVENKSTDGYIGSQIIQAFAQLPVYEDKDLQYENMDFNVEKLDEITKINLFKDNGQLRISSQQTNVDYTYNVAPNIVINLRHSSFSKSISIIVSIYDKDFTSRINCAEDHLAIVNGNVVGQLCFFMNSEGRYDMEAVTAFKFERSSYGRYQAQMQDYYYYNFSSKDNKNYGHIKSSFNTPNENKRCDTPTLEEVTEAIRTMNFELFLNGFEKGRQLK